MEGKNDFLVILNNTFLFQFSSLFQFQFDLKSISRHSGRLAIQKLDECNRLEIIEHINDPVKCDELINRVQELIKAAYPN